MALLSRIPMVLITHFGALETLGTIFLCYILAVSLGHVQAWLPMISDCAVESPERYPFRIGILVGALVIGFNTVVFYKADRAFSNSKLCLFLGVVGSVGLSIVAVVNEKENNSVHSTAAVIFFVCYDLYMVLMTVFVHQEPTSGLASRMVKITCASVGVACLGLLTAIVLRYLPMDIYLAVFEWLDTFAIAFFIWSFALDDLKGLEVDLVRESKLTYMSEKETETNL